MSTILRIPLFYLPKSDPANALHSQRTLLGHGDEHRGILSNLERDWPGP